MISLQVLHNRRTTLGFLGLALAATVGLKPIDLPMPRTGNAPIAATLCDTPSRQPGRAPCLAFDQEMAPSAAFRIAAMFTP